MRWYLDKLDCNNTVAISNLVQVCTHHRWEASCQWQWKVYQKWQHKNVPLWGSSGLRRFSLSRRLGNTDGALEGVLRQTDLLKAHSAHAMNSSLAPLIQRDYIIVVCPDMLCRHLIIAIISIYWKFYIRSCWQSAVLPIKVTTTLISGVCIGLVKTHYMFTRCIVQRP